MTDPWALAGEGLSRDPAEVTRGTFNRNQASNLGFGINRLRSLQGNFLFLLLLSVQEAMTVIAPGFVLP